MYVAPMKALAAEVTGAFSRRLAPLGISVRELTGDTQLSKKELEETQMIVTTPEKWDVITRKGEGGVGGVRAPPAHHRRGAPAERRARTRHRDHRRANAQAGGDESEHDSHRRSVGDASESKRLAAFLGVSDAGLFVFDQSFRPIPLTQMFVGVTETNAMKRATLMAEVAYRKCAGRCDRGNRRWCLCTAERTR